MTSESSPALPDRPAERNVSKASRRRERAYDTLEVSSPDRERAFRDRVLATMLALRGARGAELFAYLRDEHRNGLQWVDIEIKKELPPSLGRHGSARWFLSPIALSKVVGDTRKCSPSDWGDSWIAGGEHRQYWDNAVPLGHRWRCSRRTELDRWWSVSVLLAALDELIIHPSVPQCRLAGLRRLGTDSRRSDYFFGTIMFFSFWSETFRWESLSTSSGYLLVGEPTSVVWSSDIFICYHFESYNFYISSSLSCDSFLIRELKS